MKKIIVSVCIFLVVVSFVVLPAYSKLSLYTKKTKIYSALEKKIGNEINCLDSETSVLIKDLNSPDLKLSFSGQKKFPAASLIKLPILAVAFKAVTERKISLSRIITIKRADISGGSGAIKAMRLPVKLRFSKLLELMITQSDNTATNKVISILGFDYINNGFKELGLHSTYLKRKMMDFSNRRKGIENYTTVNEIAYLLEKIYNKQLIGPKSSRLMLSLLKKQKIKDRIPRYLPNNISVAHKTGLERGVVHDAGIIFSPKGDYIICVLTKHVKNYRNAKKFIARISLLTYRMYQ